MNNTTSDKWKDRVYKEFGGEWSLSGRDKYEKVIKFCEQEIDLAVSEERKRIKKHIACPECNGSGQYSSPSDFGPCTECDGTGYRLSDGSCNDILTEIKKEGNE